MAKIIDYGFHIRFRYSELASNKFIVNNSNHFKYYDVCLTTNWIESQVFNYKILYLVPLTVSMPAYTSRKQLRHKAPSCTQKSMVKREMEKYSGNRVKFDSKAPGSSNVRGRCAKNITLKSHTGKAENIKLSWDRCLIKQIVSPGWIK